MGGGCIDNLTLLERETSVISGVAYMFIDPVRSPQMQVGLGERMDPFTLKMNLSV